MRPLIFLLLSLQIQLIFAQTTLQADGPGDTYNLINSVLAPGYNVIEAPDCSHTPFGEHIDEMFDTVLNTNVFRFHIHKSPDNDRCINFDRQRNEIKTYDKSPDNLKGMEDEIVEYKWKFKIDATFQPSGSFTHLHQLKAVDGPEAGMPTITLTARKASPDRVEMRYAETTSQTTLIQVDLEPFKGEWVEATEIVTYGENGTYSIELNKISDGSNLMTYSDTDIRMWKTDASFIRPKWGIYRSLNDSTNLKDEIVLFADFEINELASPIETDAYALQHSIDLFPNPVQDKFTIKGDLIKYDIHILDFMGNVFQALNTTENALAIDVFSLPSGLYLIQLIHQGNQNIWMEKILKQ